MKKLITFGIAAMALMALTFTQVSYAQQDPTGKPQNRGQVKPNFVDENGDGICDNQGTGGGNGTGICNGTGQGYRGGTGQGSHGETGQGIHRRLRDGSCGQTTTPSGTTAPSNIQGNRGSNTRPAK